MMINNDPSTIDYFSVDFSLDGGSVNHFWLEKILSPQPDGHLVAHLIENFQLMTEQLKGMYARASEHDIEAVSQTIVVICGCLHLIFNYALKTDTLPALQLVMGRLRLDNIMSLLVNELDCAQDESIATSISETLLVISKHEKQHSAVQDLVLKSFGKQYRYRCKELACYFPTTYTFTKESAAMDESSTFRLSAVLHGLPPAKLHTFYSRYLADFRTAVETHEHVSIFRQGFKYMWSVSIS